MRRKTDARSRRRDEEAEQSLISRLRRAFLAVRKKAPEFELFAVPAGGVGERPTCIVPRDPARERSLPPDGRLPESEAAEARLDDGPEVLPLFRPGPLHHLAVTPERTQVELLGTQRLLAIPRDADKRRLRLPRPVVWRVLSGPGRILPEGVEGTAGRFFADFMEGTSVLEATASDGQRSVAGQAVVRTVPGLVGRHPGLGIPAPAFVEDRSGDWRSRMRDGIWEVNRAHADFRDASTAERRQLRYLSSLLAKEIVASTWPSPQTSRVLEQFVRLLAIVELSLD